MKKMLFWFFGLTVVTAPTAPTGCTFSGGIQTDYGTITRTSDGNTSVVLDARRLGGTRGFAK